MLYYRYRSGNELTMKELIYDEMFFAAAEECNDPYEGRFFAEFPKDEEKWGKLIDVVTDGSGNKLKESFTKFFLKKSPVSVGEVLKVAHEELYSIATDAKDMLILEVWLLKLKEYITRYMPSEQYFVCFTKQPDNYLMWSHYANNHRGFCLVFRSIEGEIKQNPYKKRTRVSYVTPNAFASRMSFEIADFVVKDIEYKDNPPMINAFMGFPQSINGNNCSKEELLKFRTEYDNTYYCKHTVWEYEQEARILLSGGMSWLAGERLSLSTHKRLFYYDSTQLVGIIFGARMPENQKGRIREIMTEKVNSWYDGSREKCIVSDFVVFEEQLSEVKREIKIEPIEIYGVGVCKKGEEDFEKKYHDWKEGYAVLLEGSGAKKIKIAP